MKTTPKDQKILGILLKSNHLQSSDIHRELNTKDESVSLVTVKRTLSKMARNGLITKQGKGRSTGYFISDHGRLLAKIDIEKYVSIDPDRRWGQKSYNFTIFQNFPKNIFSEEEQYSLVSATSTYKEMTQGMSTALAHKELERLVIELSWKSSRIEGNTYTLLDTEKLILKNIEALGHDKKESQMILNHKEAFEYIYEHQSIFQKLTVSNIFDIHDMLVKNLEVKTGLREKPVGVTGSLYRPLDNKYQINEALCDLVNKINESDNPYAKSLFALVGIGYIQAFDDGNKRTARLIANALLLANDCAPMSYRSVGEDEYRNAMLVFYELNSLVACKKIFIEQYIFGANNYAV